MKNKVIIISFLLAVFLTGTCAAAAQIKAYVGEFAVSGMQGRDELKGTLQTLLSSRLNDETILTVDAATGADVLVSGSYVVIGKVYSLDAVAKEPSGRVLTRVFEQGEGQDELIPAVGRIAQKLKSEILKSHAQVTTAPLAAAPPVVPKPEAAVPAPAEIVKPQPAAKDVASGWISQRIAGAMTGLAVGRTVGDGERELFVAGSHTLKFYRQGKELKLVAEYAFKTDEQVLGIDTADLDGDGKPEIYVTAMSGEALASQVWTVDGDNLKKIAGALPYYFRAIALEGKEKRVYAQQMGRDADFYGNVHELVKIGEKYDLKTPITLPRFGHIYNFNRFTDGAGKSHYVVINEDGYLVVYSVDGEELWRSSDKFGGSEMYFKRDDITRMRFTGDQYRWIFLEQRIAVNKAGEIIVPRNSGTFVVGNNRSYRKNSVFCFTWNGSSLEEKWRTKENQNYLADFSYDEAGKELILLEVVKKEGIVDKGASAVSIKRVE
ncbi:MAG: hypothetical protein FD174_1813 [Geobacteraceae bacterium]|nr:MAG: hypothetical protein FD174_1813 [Geobacteraceae bacterium]